MALLAPPSPAAARDAATVLSCASTDSVTRRIRSPSTAKSGAHFSFTYARFKRETSVSGTLWRSSRSESGAGKRARVRSAFGAFERWRRRRRLGVRGGRGARSGEGGQPRGVPRPSSTEARPVRRGVERRARRETHCDVRGSSWDARSSSSSMGDARGVSGDTRAPSTADRFDDSGAFLKPRLVTRESFSPS